MEQLETKQDLIVYTLATSGGVLAKLIREQRENPNEVTKELIQEMKSDRIKFLENCGLSEDDQDFYRNVGMQEFSI